MRKDVKAVLVVIAIVAVVTIVFAISKEIDFQSCLLNNSLFDCDQMMDE